VRSISAVVLKWWGRAARSPVSFTIDRYVKVYRDDVREAVQRNDRPAVAR